VIQSIFFSNPNFDGEKPVTSSDNKNKNHNETQGVLLKVKLLICAYTNNNNNNKRNSKKEFGAHCKYPLRLLEPGRTTLQAGIPWVQTQNHLTKMKQPNPIRSTCFMIFEIENT